MTVLCTGLFTVWGREMVVGVEREDGVLVGEGGSYFSEKGYSLIHG